MATKTEIRLVDDLDGSDADETVLFGVAGTGYEIDLSDVNAKALRAVLEPYIAAGRRTGRVPSQRSGSDNEAMRAWAKRRGIEVAERGRVREDIERGWRAAGCPR